MLVRNDFLSVAERNFQSIFSNILLVTCSVRLVLHLYYSEA